MLSEKDKSLVCKCLQMALEAGASKARASLSKSSMDLVGTLDGGIDKVTSCQDSAISIAIFADGRYGSFSTNKLSEDSLKSFISRAVDTVKMLAADECRDLADPSRTVKDALTGDELKIHDAAYSGVSAEDRVAAALNAALKTRSGDGWKVVSEESEYSDSEYFNYIVDTNGLEALHSETSFDYWTEITIEAADGRKYSGSWWESAPMLADFDCSQCGAKALKMAVDQINPVEVESGKYNLVVDRDVASKLVSPILSALNAFSIQQGNSFLVDTLGKQVFPEGLTIMDCPRIEGQLGSKYFDSEGVATVQRPIIENGIVREYFVNTYMANKLNIAPTQEDATRPKLMPFGHNNLNEIMSFVGDGILVTEFNGGNSNSATGDFSYGIQGFRFKDGKIVHPVSEMLVTGNFIELWGKLLAAGDDARPCMTKLIPTLAFADVDFSG